MQELPGKADCLWTATAPVTHYERLRGPHRFDVVIVGAGIVGLTAAMELVARGRSVALVEARRIGQQVTGRSTAKITTQHSLIYRHLIDTIGLDKTKLYADANRTAADHIRQLVATHVIDCDYEGKNAFVYIGPNRTRLDDLEAEAEAASALGFAAEVLDRAPLPFATGGALRFSGQAQFNPAKYLVGLAAVAAASGITVFENSRVTSVEPGKHCIVTTNEGTITARDVLVATNTPIASPESYDARLQPGCHVVMAFRIADQDAPDGMFIGADQPTHSIRTGRDDGGTALVVLGPRFNTGQEIDVARRFRELADWATNNFRVGEAAWRWANEDMETADCLPFVGPLKPHNPNFYVATGFNGWGISNGTAAGLLVADQILERENSWAVLYDPTRQPPKGLLQRSFSATPISSLDLIGPGGGAIVEHGGAKIGVWKDDDGIAHAVSATCTHKGCTVTWNNAERTWDCPCHGSIFAADGSIVHGPATQPLPSVAVPTQ